MEQLFEFLFGNFFFLIILVYLIYAMFFRKSSLEKPENRPGRQQANRPDGRPVRRTGGYPPVRPGDFPANRRGGFPPGPSGFPGGRPSGRLEGPFAPAERMPDFGGSPIFPTPPATGHREPRPEYVEADAYPEPAAPIPAPVYVLPEQPDELTVGDRPRSAFESPDFVPLQELPLPAGKSSASADVVVAAPEPRRSVPISLSGDDLVRAVVWSEILGPPRARRPFRK